MHQFLLHMLKYFPFLFHCCWRVWLNACSDICLAVACLGEVEEKIYWQTLLLALSIMTIGLPAFDLQCKLVTVTIEITVEPFLNIWIKAHVVLTCTNWVLPVRQSSTSAVNRDVSRDHEISCDQISCTVIAALLLNDAGCWTQCSNNISDVCHCSGLVEDNDDTSARGVQWQWQLISSTDTCKVVDVNNWMADVGSCPNAKAENYWSFVTSTAINASLLLHTIVIINTVLVNSLQSSRLQDCGRVYKSLLVTITVDLKLEIKVVKRKKSHVSKEQSYDWEDGKF